MAIFHCSISVISRGKGKAAVASSAYRSGEKIKNDYDGEVHDYTRKGGVIHTEIVLPDHAPKEYADRSTLWNAVEKIEKSKNAQLARDIEVSIPKELPREQWALLMREYCKANFVDKGMIADFCIHDIEDGNPHCHIMLTMRPLKENGEWGAKSRKEYLLDDSGNRIKLPSGNWKSVKVDTTDWNSQDNAELWRGNWANICNRFLEQNGVVERIDHRSYERQGIDQIPTIHLGVSASQMEQKGIVTDRGNQNRQIKADNKELRATTARITRLMKWQREEKAKPLDLSQTGEKVSVRAMLLSHNPEMQGNRRKDIKALQNYASILVFMEQNGIENLEDFHSKIADMNKGFYVLKGEVESTEKAIENIDRRLSLWEEYKKVKPMIERHNALTGKKKQATYEKYKTQLDNALELQQKWVDFKNDGGKIVPKQWSKERESLQRDISLCEWKMKAFKDELSRAEGIQKVLMQMMNEPTQERGKMKETER